MDQSAGQVILDLLFFVLASSWVIIIYFLPTFVANIRNLKYRSSVFALNLCFGWVTPFWVLLLLYSLAKDN